MDTPMLVTPNEVRYQLEGTIGRLLKGVTNQWLLVAPLANPAMLEIFADRNSPPFRNLVPWAGEFAGKYLTSAVQVWRLTRDAHLASFLEEFVPRLVQLQDSDGYLGPWPADCHLANFSPYHGTQGLQTWDTWGHYHIMTGLMFWVEETGDEKALECVCRIADLICQKYLGEQPIRLVDTGSTEMNLAPVHSLARLYRQTGASRYLEMALQIVDEFGAQGVGGFLAGDYLQQALAGKAFFEMPKPRWESLHPVMGLAELYWITGEERYRTAFEQIWWSIAENDRHNNGGFSSGEQATGNPYQPGPIETCCTIAWIALSVEMLKLTSNSIVADEIELSTLNSVLGMHSPTGRWATYNTPSDGARFASSHSIVFQARSGSPELNCCSVNSPRGLGLISEWAVMRDQEGLVLNYYGPATIQIPMKDMLTVEIKQETDYPVSGDILIQVSPSAPAEFSLRLRVPYWSENTHLSLNQQELEGLHPGHYYEIGRLWRPGDALHLKLDMSPHFWYGERECQDFASIYLGPLLLAYDQRYNRHLSSRLKVAKIPEDPWQVTGDHLSVPTLDTSQISFKVMQWNGWFSPLLLLESRIADGEPVYLCDFSSAGMTGTLYRSWLPIANSSGRTGFSPANPLRCSRK